MPAVTTNTGQNQSSLPEQPKHIPYVQDGQLLNAVPPPKPPKPSAPTQADLQAGSNQVMATAQNMAMNKADQPNQTMGLVEQQMQGMLQNPMGQGYDRNQYINNQLQQFDRNRANNMQAFQQQTADVGNTGANMEKMYNFAMQGAQERTDLEQQLIKDAQDRERAAMLDALDLGGTTAQRSVGLDSEAFNRLIAARQGFEGERSDIVAQGEAALDRAHNLTMQLNDVEGQKAIVTLQGQIESGLQADRQVYEAGQAALDRALEKFRAEGDWENAEKVVQLKGEIDKEMQLAGFAHERDIVTLQGDIEQGLLKTKQDWQGAQNDLDREIEKYTAEGSWENALEAIRLKGEVDKGLMQVELDNSLTLMEADQAGQMAIEELRGKIQMNQLLTAQDFEGTQNGLDRALAKYQSEGDWANAQEVVRLKGEIDSMMQERELENRTNIATMQNDTERWKQTRVEELTRAGWDHETALQKSDQEHQALQASLARELEWAINEAGLDMEDKRLVQQATQFASQQEWETWAKEQDLNEARWTRVWQAGQNALDRALTSREASLDRQLDKEIEGGRIALADRQLVQEALLAGNQIAWEERALRMGFDESERMRIWETAERVSTQTWESQERLLEREFADKGINYQTLVSNLENLEPAQAAALIKKEAEKVGIEVPDIYENLSPQEKANAEYQDFVNASLTKFNSGVKLTGEEVQAVVDSGQFQNITGMTPNKWVDGVGVKNHWALRPEAKALEGQTVVYNGKLYKVTAAVDKNERHFKAYLTLQDVETGKTVKVGG